MSRYFRRRKYCRFTAEGITEIDYKDIELLKGFVTETGLVISVSWLLLSNALDTLLCCRTQINTRLPTAQSPYDSESRGRRVEHRVTSC